MSKAAERRRADVVRNRRQEHAQKRVSESTILATRPQAPITARRMPMTSGPVRATPSRVKRRPRPAIKMPGIEVHLPSIRFSSQQVQWRLVSLALSLCLGTALYMTWNLPLFRAAAVRVVGNEGITAGEIGAVMGSDGQWIFSLTPRELETRLRSNFPELTSAHVSVGLPNDVSVTVTQRKPEIIWQQGGGYTWIDDSGVAFRPRGTVSGLITVKADASPKPSNAAGADTFSPAPYLSADLVNSIKTLATQAPAGATILFDPNYGLGWTDPRGWQAYFGIGAREMALRLQVYQALVRMLDSEGLAPAFINVQFPTAPYYRMTQ